jgi:DNA-3-methyladenine glycosylase
MSTERKHPLTWPPLPDSFYLAKADIVARALLGCYLVHASHDGCTVGRIVETEAYFNDDPASHAFRGETPRNRAMFGQGGTAYVYRSYGVHWCFNVVVGSAGDGTAVLIRALEPVFGETVMMQRRGLNDVRELMRGPGKLTTAMGIDVNHNTTTLLRPPLFISLGSWVGDVVVTPRIGISRGEELLLRFYLKDNRFVSGSRRRR